MRSNFSYFVTHYIITVSGPPQMNLVGDIVQEHLQHHQLILNQYVPLSSCGKQSTESPAFPVPFKNYFFDQYGYYNIPLVKGLTGTRSVSCGDLENQWYTINACTVPLPPKIVNIQTYVIAPNSLMVLRSDPTP